MIYLDNASTTPCLRESAEIVAGELTENYFNPSAKYKEALNNSKMLDECRKKTLEMVGARDSDYTVIFTGSATEANNLVLNSNLNRHKTNIISAGEHSSVFETAKEFKSRGVEILEAPLSKVGVVDMEAFKKLCTKDTGLISIMLVSNETGAINNIKELVKYARSLNPKVLFHVDAVQGFCKIKISAQEWGVDYLTLSSHKVEGPKGVGALVVKKSAKLEPEIFGGGQEMGKRSGTENLPGILGFVNSAKKLSENLVQNYNNVKTFKLKLIENLTHLSAKEGLEFIVNGEVESSSPYILSLGFKGTKGEVLLHALEAEGILVGTGSACNSKHSGNRVLQNMGRTKEEIECNIRVSFAPSTTKHDVNKIAETIIRLAKRHNNTVKR